MYLDRPGLPLGQRALTSPRDCLKVSATHEPDGTWRVETKEEDGNVTRRTWINVKAQHLRFVFGLSGRELLPAMPEDLVPAFACAFERTPYTHPDGWRVAVDHGLRIHLADARAWTATPNGPELGPCLAQQQSTVFCVQYGPRGVPSWLRQLEADRAVPFSRFAIGVRQVQLAQGLIPDATARAS